MSVEKSEHLGDAGPDAELNFMLNHSLLLSKTSPGSAAHGGSGRPERTVMVIVRLSSLILATVQWTAFRKKKELQCSLSMSKLLISQK